MAGRNTKDTGLKFRLSITVAFIVMIVIVTIVLIRSYTLTKTLEKNRSQITELNQSIAEEKERTEEIEQFSKEVQTNEYKEEVAKDKLGLVNEGEIIFKIEDDGGGE